MSVALQVPVVYIHATHACDQQAFFHWLLMIIVTLLDHAVAFTMVHKMSRHITEIIPHTWLIIIIKSEAWTVIHCLRLGHETMVCAVYLYIFTVLKGVRNTPFPEECIIDSDIDCDIFVMCKYTWIITWNTIHKYKKSTCNWSLTVCTTIRIHNPFSKPGYMLHFWIHWAREASCHQT